MSFYSGKTVFVTGASSGIGAAFAREVSSLGANLVLTARRKNLLSDLSLEIERSGGKALAIECDVTKRSDLDHAVVEARSKFGKIDIVLANAGFGVDGSVEKTTLDDYRRQFDTNVFGVIETIQATLPELKKNRGAIALVGSVMGHFSMPGGSPYAMSKFAVTALAESLWYEMKSEGVSVTLVSPGFIDSEIRRVGNDGRLRPDAKDPVPKWLMMPAPKAAKIIARSIASGRKEVVVTWHGKTAVILHRYFPRLFQFAVSRSPL